MQALKIRDAELYKSYLEPEAQADLVAKIKDIVARAPLFSPVTARGQTMSVRMTSAGQLGWVSDRKGYRYEPRHPEGGPWPDIPERVLELWRAVSGCAREPECCLVNYYAEKTRMGLHQDRDEADFSLPVVSISLGDAALFRIGNHERGGKTESFWLETGDVLVMGGAARLRYHGVDRIKFGSSRLLKNGGRLNLTLRVVT